MDAERVVRGNETYRSDALQILNLAADAMFTFVRCSACGFVYAEALPDSSFLQRLYSEVIDGARAATISQSPAWVSHQLELAARLLARASGGGAIRVLDYGCGDGTVTKALNAAGVSCLGFEPYPREAGSPAQHRITDSRDVIRAAAPFTSILLSDVLEHVPEPRSVLDECRDLLETGGWICISVPDFSAGRLRSVLGDLSAGRTVTAELNPWEHLNYFSPATLAAMVRAAGFDVAIEPARQFGFREDGHGVRRISNALFSAGRLFRFVALPAHGSTTVFARKS